MGKKRKVVDNAGGPSREYNVWDSKHDEPFLQCLLELTEKGQISDGTCKNGAYKELERMMEAKVPGCGVKSKPTILNKFKKWKQKYHATVEMRLVSGWGWDPIRCHILADDKSFDDYVKVHTHCKGMNKKPFPQFWALEPVFAKGRANGETGFTGNDGNSSYTSAEGEEPQPECFEESVPFHVEDFNNDTTEEVMADIINEGVEARNCSKRKHSSKPNSTKKKKKVQADDSTSEVAAEMREMRPLIDRSAETIARALGESELQNSMRLDLMKNLEKLEGLTRSQMVLACRRLNNSLGDLKTFYNMETEEDKMTLVLDILSM
ncbi:unnamed protein product [Linum tenue]|nr:unnamed protein product [Linum tenue]CAI0547646.1 unnamed protein product [Linum tenue]